MRSIAKKAKAVMVEQVEIHLKYEGPDVENGTMALQDVIPVLQGISGAYARLADIKNRDVTHRIKLSGVRQGSADIVLEVYEIIANNPEAIAAGIETFGRPLAMQIVRRIFDVIKIKIHIGNSEFKERISAENSIVVSNSSNVQIVVPHDSFGIFKDGKLRKDLELLTRPLTRGRIDSAEFEVQSSDGESLSQRITVEDRPYFEIIDLAVTATKETELIATLNSLTKSTNKGYLYLQNGNRVTYRYIGDAPQRFYELFGSYDGPVKIRCIAKLDDKLEVVSIEILQIDRLQNELFDGTSYSDP